MPEAGGFTLDLGNKLRCGGARQNQTGILVCSDGKLHWQGFEESRTGKGMLLSVSFVVRDCSQSSRDYRDLQRARKRAQNQSTGRSRRTPSGLEHASL